MGGDFRETADLLEESEIKLKEALDRVEKFRDRIVSDPRTLDEVISRQDLIDKLKKKYGASIAEILQYRAKIALELGGLEGHAEHLETMKKQADQNFKELMRHCKTLTASRKRPVKTRGCGGKELRDLGFAKAAFSVRMDTIQDESGKESPTAPELRRWNSSARIRAKENR